MKIAIIGGGLAGTACAYVLKRRGAEPVIYDAAGALASGASGNAVGMYNPKITAFCSPESAFYAAAFALALRTFEAMGADQIDFYPCGALHLINDEKKEKRYRQTVQNWGWPAEDLMLVDAAQASEIAGVPLAHDALYIRRSGVVSPAKLCAGYAADVPVVYDHPVTALETLEADAIILANGMGAGVFPETEFLPLRAVRGQVTHIEATAHSKKQQCCLCYSGYMTPDFGDGHTVGSTFQRWLDHSEIIEDDDQENIQKMTDNIPVLRNESYTVTGHRASMRTTVPDHMPVIGEVPDAENLYVSTAHGSHGILSALMGAHVLADMILGEPLSLGRDSLSVISPQRFL